MINWISKQNKKTKEERRRTAISLSLSITLIIIGFWLISILASVNNQSSIKETKDPVDSLGASFSSAIDSFMGLFDGSIEYQ